MSNMRKEPLHYADLLLPHFHDPASTNGTNFVGVLMLFSSLLVYALTLAYACKHAVSSWFVVCNHLGTDHLVVLHAGLSTS